MRGALFRRLLLALCGIAATSVGLVLLLQERSLSADLERAADARLARAATAARRLLELHLDASAERYALVSRTPQFRATLEIRDVPTLEHFAESIFEQQGARRIAFVTGEPGRILAGAGDARLDAEAIGVDGRGWRTWDGSLHLVVSTPIARGGRLIAIERIDGELLSEWSALCGAQIELAGPGTHEPELVREVLPLAVGQLRVSSSLEPEREAVRRARLNLATAAGFGLALALIVSLFVSRSLVRPILELERSAQRIGAGDLTTRIASNRDDEIGAATRAFSQMVADLNETLRATVRSADRVDATARAIGAECERFREVTEAQRRQSESTVQALDGIQGQMQETAVAAGESAQLLDASVDGSTASFRELAGLGSRLDESAGRLQQQVDAISTAIGAVAERAEEVAQATDRLLPVVDTTARSVGDLSRSASEVSAHVEETARLSDAVVERAEEGRGIVEHAVEGMRSVQSTIHDSERVVRDLNERINEIGGILTVIDDVTEETNLLALNGSIVASQAGEHGRAFAVVADQLRDLANRVQHGTKEIGSVIQAVQRERDNAVASISEGSARAETGVSLIEKAAAALVAIATSARESRERMGQSTAATAEQLRLATTVSEEMGAVREGIEGIRGATREQTELSDLVQHHRQALHAVASEVSEAVDDQRRGVARIEKGIESVQGVVTRMTAGLTDQIASGNRITEEMRRVVEQFRSHETSTKDIDSAARGLEEEARALRASVHRFQLDDGEDTQGEASVAAETDQPQRG